MNLRTALWQCEEVIMQMAITFMAVVAGLIFSVAVALLAEELIFGQVFRLFFVRQGVPQTVPVKTGRSAESAKGEDDAGVEVFADYVRRGHDDRGPMHSHL
jgi:hypothetical protein